MNTIYSKYDVREQDTPIIQHWEWLHINTAEYEAQTVSGSFQDFSKTIAKVLSGENVKWNENILELLDAEYPGSIQWKIRQEALTSIWYKEVGGTIQYITRKRPNQEKSNTPGAEDVWVIFHGIDNWTVISPRRFIADSTGKLRDDEVSPEEVAQFFSRYWGLFQGYELITLGHLILTCGNIARKEWMPVSGLMQANIILLTQKQVEKIMDLNSNPGNVNYTLRDAGDSELILNPENGEVIPKLEAYRELLRNKAIN